jgi:hypothetical protein
MLLQAIQTRRYKLGWQRLWTGELIWAMTTCRPDLAYAGVKLSQANACPHEHHFHGVKHALKYLYSTREDGLYYWRTAPCDEFPEGRYRRSIATSKTSSWRNAQNTTHTCSMHMPTLIGLLASKHVDLLGDRAFTSLEARLLTSPNFTPQ